MFPLGKPIDTERGLYLLGSWGEKELEETNGCKVSFGDDENVLKLVVMVSQLWIC